MSLNRSEQALHAYIDSHSDERRFWQDKVRSATAGTQASPAVAQSLERELQGYFMERSRNVPALQRLAIGNTTRVSLLNLAELMIRLWGAPPRPRKPAAE